MCGWGGVSGPLVTVGMGWMFVLYQSTEMVNSLKSMRVCCKYKIMPVFTCRLLDVNCWVAWLVCVRA